MLKKIVYFIILLSIFGVSSKAAVPDIMAEGAILIEAKTNTILYEKNAYQRFYPASMTKILTALIIQENMPEGTIISKTKDSVQTVPSDSSHIGLQIGDTFDKKNGLYGLLLGSDNFIAHDLAVKLSGSIPNFAQLMNQKAKELGAKQTHFTNPHGYHETNHYTTPYDMSQIAKGAFSNETVEKIAGTRSYSFYVKNRNKSLAITNSSRLVKSETAYYNPNVVATKTGFHDDAGQTLVTKAKYGDMELIAVVMKEKTPNQYIDVNTLFEYGKTYYSVEQVNGMYQIKNNTATNWSKPYIEAAIKEGWLKSDGKSYTEPIKVEELVIFLKKLGSSYGGVTMTECQSLVGLGEGEQLTRAQVAKIMRYTVQKWKLQKEVKESQLSIPDLMDAPTSLQDDIRFVVQRELIGKTNQAFRPNVFLTREEAICMLYKLTDSF